LSVWTELSIEVPPAAAEILASAVAELTGGVEIRDGGTIIRADAGRAVIVTQCAPDAVDEVLEAIELAAARARENGLEVDPLRVRQRQAHEDEWRDVWKQYFRATRVGRTFLVRPSWDQPPARAGDRVIDLDPGRAFGTGGHASTRLCIALAEELEGRPVRRFLDLGCGSGILAVAAARLWPAAAGLAVDLDPEAAACAAENLARNGVTGVETRAGTLADVEARRDHDLVLANIQADVLVALAPALPARLAPGASVILSGLLAGDVPGVLEAFRAVGLVEAGRRTDDEWAALLLAAP
jgi:ribosomal protein L11 methyltransferase